VSALNSSGFSCSLLVLPARFFFSILSFDAREVDLRELFPKVGRSENRLSFGVYGWIDSSDEREFPLLLIFISTFLPQIFLTIFVPLAPLFFPVVYISLGPGLGRSIL